MSIYSRLILNYIYFIGKNNLIEIIFELLFPCLQWYHGLIGEHKPGKHGKRARETEVNRMGDNHAALDDQQSIKN